MLVKISVLMPCRNAERTIRSAVDSVLCQTFSDFELIVVDESSDGTADILDSYRDKRVRVLRPKRRLGLVSALNTGVRLSNGEYIARMDADDISLPERLSICSSYLDAHSEVGAVAGEAFFRCGDIVYPSPFAGKIHAPASINRFLLDANPIVTSAAMLRKSALIRVGAYDSFFRRWPYGEDYDLVIRIAGLYVVSLLPDYVCVYAVGKPESLTVNLGRIRKLMGLCRAKLRAAVCLARNPLDILRALASIIRSVEIDMICGLTHHELWSYLLNIENLRRRF